MYNYKLELQIVVYFYFMRHNFLFMVGILALYADKGQCAI